MTTIFINELHYENVGRDVGEGVEIAGPAGTQLDGWMLEFYESRGLVYEKKNLNGIIPNLQNGFGTLFFYVAGIVNPTKGGGVALIDPKRQPVQFLRTIKAQEGNANGLKSQLLPVVETTSTKVGFSLQLQGTGNVYEDFTWAGPLLNTYGSPNQGQTFVVKDKKENSTTDGISWNLKENRKKHFTDSFHTEDMLMLRRGFEFSVKIQESGGIDASKITVAISYYPDNKLNLTLPVEATKPSTSNKWYSYSSNISKTNVDVNIGIPADAHLGTYTIALRVAGGKSYKQEPMTILANPWCQEDTVFMADQAQRQEYVLEDDGLIWVGNQYSYSPRAWNFAQFNTKSIQGAILLLQKIPFAERNDPVMISRQASALVNSNDEDGVIVGNWSGDYTGGKKPTEWTGSADILREYSLNQKPVKFGQCWVFAGVLTTVMRALGIPCRPVTNFNSAHDTNFNRAVDKYYKKKGLEVDEEKTSDSVWNFHVWNEVWMRRPDLKSPKYFGWQIIDATPQEMSDNIYQTGPVPLIAVKEGEKDINYDLEFVYSEVNADEREWVENDTGDNYTLIRTVSDSIGKSISTKAVGTQNRQDLTNDYKFTEGSIAERSTVALDNSGDVLFEILIDEKSQVGKPLQARLLLKRKEGTTGPRTASVQFTAAAAQYTGMQRATIKQEIQNVTLPNDSTPIFVSLELAVNEYLRFIRSECVFVFKAFVRVKESKQSTVVSKDFEFPHPELQIVVLEADKFTQGKEATARVTFTNQLPFPLTSLVLSVEGQDMTKVQTFELGSLQPSKTFTQDLKIFGWKKGKRLLIAALSSFELFVIKSYITVVVK